jgi:hypothetical protein
MENWTLGIIIGMAAMLMHRLDRLGKQLEAVNAMIAGYPRRTIAPIDRPRDRGNEAVTPPGKRRDISSPIRSIAECLAQVGDVNPQTAFFHGDVGPDAGQQIPLAHNLVRAGHTRNASSTSRQCGGA